MAERPSNAEIHERRTKWAEALRSGKYSQTRGALQRTRPPRFSDGGDMPQAGFCCLGVACEVAIENGVGISRGADERYGQVAYVNKETGYSTTAYLPLPVAEYFGMDSNPEVTLVGEDGIPGETHSLSHLNDDLLYDFEQIAQVVLDVEVLTPESITGPDNDGDFQ